MPAANENPLFWIGSSKKDLMALPTAVRRFFGHAFNFAQHGGQHAAAKVLKGFAGAGVLEVVIATPKQGMDIIRARLKVAETLVKELRNGKADR